MQDSEGAIGLLAKSRKGFQEVMNIIFSTIAPLVTDLQIDGAGEMAVCVAESEENGLDAAGERQ